MGLKVTESLVPYMPHFDVMKCKMKKPNQIYVFLLLATSLVVFPDIHRAFSVAQFHFKFPNQGLVFPNMTIDWLKLTIDGSILTIIISIFYGIRWARYLYAIYAIIGCCLLIPNIKDFLEIETKLRWILYIALFYLIGLSISVYCIFSKQARIWFSFKKDVNANNS